MPDPKIDLIRAELEDFQNSLNAARAARENATKKKTEQSEIAASGQEKIESTKASVDTANAEAEAAANQAEVAAQVAERQLDLEVKYMISLVTGENADDPTPAPAPVTA